MKETNESNTEMKVWTNEIVKFNMMYSPIYDGHHTDMMIRYITDMHDIVLKHYCLYYVYKHVYTYINNMSSIRSLLRALSITTYLWLGI